MHVSLNISIYVRMFRHLICISNFVDFRIYLPKAEEKTTISRVREIRKRHAREARDDVSLQKTENFNNFVYEFLKGTQSSLY